MEKTSIANGLIPVKSMGQHLKPSVLIPTVTAGLTTGLLCAALSISFTAIIFTGDLSAYLPLAIGIALLSSVLVCLLGVLFGSSSSMVATTQDAPSVLLALAAISVSKSLGSSSNSEDVFYTVLAVNGLTTIITAIALLMIAKFRLASIVRFIPYPVIGGFLAGTGWLLFNGGMSFLIADQVNWLKPGSLFDLSVLKQWLPAVVFGIGIMIVTAKLKHYLVWPALLLGSCFAFFLTMFFMGSSPHDWREMGLLLEAFPNKSLWQPLNYGTISKLPWGIVFSQAAQTASIIVITLLAISLNTTGFQMATKEKVDLNKELRIMGWANLFTGFLGAVVAYQVLSISVLNHKISSGKRMASFIAVMVLAAALVFGAGFLAFIPKMLIGGLLIYLGLSFMLEWVYTAFFKLTKLEYALVLLILVVVVSVGFLDGIVVGIVAAFILFAINYSLAHKTQKSLSSKSILGLETSLLRASSTSLILEPLGYLFFGTATHFIEDAKKKLTAKPSLTDLNLNFEQVIGIDATALEYLLELCDYAKTKTINVQITNLNTALEPQFKRSGLASYLAVSQPVYDDVLLLPQLAYPEANYSSV